MIRFGLVAIAFGLVLDLAAHATASAGPLGTEEHLAHLVVVIGMVAVLVGAIVDGINAGGRQDRPEGSPHDAVR